MTSSVLTMTRRGLLAAAVIASSACGGGATGAATTSSAPASSSAAFSSAAPPTPRTTPPGTPAPIPSEVTVTSASIQTPSPDPKATPTPTPDPATWRIQGYVVDENGAPLGSVCVVVGPLGCKPFSPHTDDQGHWFLDIAHGTSDFDFYFEMPGYKTTWWHVAPTGPIEYDVILVKS